MLPWPFYKRTARISQGDLALVEDLLSPSTVLGPAHGSLRLVLLSEGTCGEIVA